jgi:hypothetical protein
VCGLRSPRVVDGLALGFGRGIYVSAESMMYVDVCI